MPFSVRELITNFLYMKGNLLPFFKKKCKRPPPPQIIYMYIQDGHMLRIHQRCSMTIGRVALFELFKSACSIQINKQFVAARKCIA